MHVYISAWSAYSNSVTKLREKYRSESYLTGAKRSARTRHSKADGKLQDISKLYAR